MTVSFDFALNHGSFHLRLNGLFDHKVLGVFGPSGAGKTTLLHLLAGIRKPDRGRLLLHSVPLFDSERGIDVPVYHRRIGVVFQEARLFPHMNVADNLNYGRRVAKTAHYSHDLETVVSLLELGGLLQKRPGRLSGGEMQRVALGRALLSAPRLLLLDEPLASLDQRLKRQILPFLIRIKNELAVPMIYVSHDLREILQLTDQLLIIDGGREVAHGHFLDLVRHQNVLALAPSLDYLNVLSFRLLKSRSSEGISLLEPVVDSSSKNGAPWVGPFLELPVGTRVNLALRPADIALVTHRVRNISVQNQISGLVESVTYAGRKAWCVVDIGPRLLAEITPQAASELDLKPGRSIVCLFKAQAVNYLD